MAGGYHLVYSRLWADPRFRAMTEDGRHATLYVLTCPHRNTEGLFRLPTVFAAHDLGWDPARTVRAFDELEAGGWIAVDPATDLVWLVDAVADNPPRGPKQVKGAVNKLADVPVSPLRVRYLDRCREVCQPLADAIDTHLRWNPSDTVSEPYPDGSDTPSIAHSHSHSQSHPHLAAADGPGDPDTVAHDPMVVAVADRVIGTVALDEPANAWERTVIAAGLAAGLHPDTLHGLAVEAACRPGVSNPRAYLIKMIQHRTDDRNPAPITALAAPGQRRGALDDERPACGCGGSGMVGGIGPDGTPEPVTPCPACTGPGPRRARATAIGATP